MLDSLGCKKRRVLLEEQSPSRSLSFGRFGSQVCITPPSFSPLFRRVIAPCPGHMVVDIEVVHHQIRNRQRGRVVKAMPCYPAYLGIVFARVGSNPAVVA